MKHADTLYYAVNHKVYGIGNNGIGIIKSQTLDIVSAVADTLLISDNIHLGFSKLFKIWAHQRIVRETIKSTLNELT